MRVWIVGLLLVAACSIPDPRAGHCTSDGDDGLARSVNPGPDCNGDNFAHDCEIAGAPAAYGFETGCEKPAKWHQDLCQPRPRGLEGCEPLGDHIMCCPP